MLSENIKTSRKTKGLSQDELALKLNVVRQTVSKWERGLSVPDSEMLISLSDVLEVPVSTLLGENIEEAEANDLQVISEKLELINFQLAQRQEKSRKIFHGMLIAAFLIVVLIFAALVFMNSEYLGWDFNNPELAIAGTIFHGFEWIFVRLSPFVIAALIVGIVLTRKKRK